MKPKLEYYTWADRLASELEKKEVKKHVLHGMWTPSGYFHIGNARNELLIQSLIYRALEDKGVKADFNFLMDDFDDFDKVPDGLGIAKEEYEEHFGIPLREVPSPRGDDSWAEYFEEDIVSTIENFTIKPNFIKIYDEYRKRNYNDAIKIALDNAARINEIWSKIAGAREGLPITVICENCGKTATTEALAWNGSTVRYSCTKERKYTKGCNHSGEASPFDGKAKLSWRVHWPATWYINKTTFEPAGKDHFTKGGSIDTGRAFAREIFKIEPPLSTVGEFIQIHGAKISGSVGNVITLGSWIEFAEPELLRFMMISYQPQTAINFDMDSNKLSLLIDRYETAEKVFFGKEKFDNEKKNIQLKREYFLSQISKAPEKIPLRVPFHMAVMIVGLYGHSREILETSIELLKNTGHLQGKITNKDKERIDDALQRAKNWVEKYNPEMKLKVNDKVPADTIENLMVSQKKAIKELAIYLFTQRKYEDLYAKLYEIAKLNGLSSQEFFQGCYKVLIDKDAGPRLAHFILLIGQDRSRRIFEQV